MLNEQINQLQQYIDNANHIVFFGGAGVSTESGIPDFRSKDGLYNQHDVQFEQYKPEYLLSCDCLYDNPKVFYEFYRQKLDTRNVKPNITHYKLAELEQKKDLWIVTQNIDGLHQKAGSKNVLEIHGTAQKIYCENCIADISPDYIFENTDDVPKCPNCGGFIRPDVTLYGKMLPRAFGEANNKISRSDLVIVGGTSLTVYPANALITRRHVHGKLVIINKDRTTADEYADLVINESLGKVFEQLKF